MINAQLLTKVNKTTRGTRREWDGEGRVNSAEYSQAQIQENRIELISVAQLSGDKSDSIMFTHGPSKFIV